MENPLNLPLMFANLDVEKISVLDLGCGTYSSPLSTQMRDLPFARLVSVDNHLPTIRKLELQIKSKPFATKNHITRIRDARAHVAIAQNNAYDIILIMDMLEHLIKSEGVSLLEDCKRVASKGIMVWLPLGDCPEDFEELGENLSQMHKSSWAVKDLEKLGFEVAVFQDFHKQFNPPVSAAWAVWNKPADFVSVDKKPDKLLTWSDGSSTPLKHTPLVDVTTILVDRLDVHGDVLVATSILPGLHEKYPNAKIDWRVRKGFGFALQNNPYINNIIEMVGNRTLDLNDYDLEIRPDHHMHWNKPMAAVHCEQAGVPLHKPELYLTQEEIEAVPEECRDRILVANHAGWSSRVCPNLTQALAQLSYDHDFIQIDNGKNLYESIDHPTLTLREAAAYMYHAKLYIGIDTVFMHMAVAFEKPMVLCMGPTDQFTQYIPNATIIKPYEWKNPAEPYPDTKDGIQLDVDTIIAGIETKLNEDGTIGDRHPRRKMISYSTEEDYK